VPATFANVVPKNGHEVSSNWGLDVCLAVDQDEGLEAAPDIARRRVIVDIGYDVDLDVQTNLGGIIQ